METREAERSPKEAANLNGIRRKLRSQRGVTVVFALVIFLIMALFSYVMVNASLTAVQGAYASRVDEQAALSVASASRVIQRAIEDNDLPRKLQYVSKSGWYTVGDIPSSPVISSLLDDIRRALNGATPAPTLTLSTQSTEEHKKITDALGNITITLTAENRDKVTDAYNPPRVILNFHKDGAIPYFSNTVITFDHFDIQYDEMNNPSSYTVTSFKMESSLGQYQAS